ncbi:hypothetical protein RU820_04815 [Acidithiobacillus ferrooxidans]|uniref:Uncharacterized protein n=1 Tax=Acidithiobacillus ferrooxidans (strain ATCC 23270 / DSM 14882 / CIP 104768 / NCIMB 8455) TaxID=243159 RepID=B7J7I5_ACIF2|nr:MULTISPECIES: hypothetical protein [Acidithiobacillus]ACK79522.1 hypothetical protein AFE_1010 [Acidithiobacillus ferrooxidans ATCC 23270]MBN6745957.1 hypothetical protein [Acidithiobacillus sp. MC2.2]MBN6746888.1 hypothetical protein [Acidithiobacillus sp. PG05]
MSQRVLITGVGLIFAASLDRRPQLLNQFWPGTLTLAHPLASLLICLGAGLVVASLLFSGLNGLWWTLGAVVRRSFSGAGRASFSGPSSGLGGGVDGSR